MGEGKTGQDSLESKKERVALGCDGGRWVQYWGRTMFAYPQMHPSRRVRSSRVQSRVQRRREWEAKELPAALREVALHTEPSVAPPLVQPLRVCLLC